MNDFITDLDRWTRKGRGRTFQFFASDQELAGMLTTALPSDFQPYSLILVENQKIDGRFTQVATSARTEDFLDCRAAGAWRFFLRSHSLTPDVEIAGGSKVDQVLALNGLINIFHGASRRETRSISLLGVIDEVINREDGKSIRHSEYLAIFNSLRKEIGKILCYASIFNAGGKSREDTTVLISEEAAEQHRAGKVLLEAKPGSRMC